MEQEMEQKTPDLEAIRRPDGEHRVFEWHLKKGDGITTLSTAFSAPSTRK